METHIDTSNRQDQTGPEGSRILKDLNREEIMSLCGFSLVQLLYLWGIVHPTFHNCRKSEAPRKISMYDSFLVFLIFLKNYDNMERLALMMKVKPNTLCNLLHWVANLIELPLVNEFIMKKRISWVKQKEICLFNHHPHVKLVVDCTFQQSFRPRGSGKHGDYGLKIETGHRPDGICVFVSTHHPGSVHDLNIFEKNVAEYQKYLQKTPEELKIMNDQETTWSLMADKGYQGAQNFVRVVLPTKGEGGRAQNDENRKIAIERIIIENFYGRLKQKFGIIREVYRGDHRHYDQIFKICVALTNYSLEISPLRATDSKFLQSLIGYYETTIQEKKRKKEEALKASRKRRTLKNQANLGLEFS